MSRRNISDFVRTELVLKFKDEISKKAKAKQIATLKQNSSICQISDKREMGTVDTKKELAKMAGVSHDTVHKVEKIIENSPKHIKDFGKTIAITRFAEMVMHYNLVSW